MKVSFFFLENSAKTTWKTRRRRTTILKSLKETAYSLENGPVEYSEKLCNEHLEHIKTEYDYINHY